MSSIVVPRATIAVPRPLDIPGWLDTTTRRGRDTLRRWRETLREREADVVETHTFDQNLGSTVANPLSSTGTQALTTSAAAASGTLLVITAGAFGAGTFSPSVAGGSLTWTVNKSGSNGSMRLLVASAYAAAGLASGSTITVTYGSNMTDRFVGGMSFTGSQVSDTGRVDNSASSTTGSGSTWVSGAFSTTNADDVIVGVGMVDGSNSVFTPDGGWTEVHDTNDGQGDSWESVYQIVAATSSYTAGGDAVTNGSASLGMAVAYKAAAGAGSTSFPFLRAETRLGHLLGR